MAAAPTAETATYTGAALHALAQVTGDHTSTSAHVLQRKTITALASALLKRRMRITWLTYAMSTSASITRHSRVATNLYGTFIPYTVVNLQNVSSVMHRDASMGNKLGLSPEQISLPPTSRQHTTTTQCSTDVRSPRAPLDHAPLTFWVYTSSTSIVSARRDVQFSMLLLARSVDAHCGDAESTSNLAS